MALALRSLDAPEMITLSADWLGVRRATITTSPELAALLPRLEEAHRALEAAQRSSSGQGHVDPALVDQARLLDERHDHAVRALYYAVSAALSFHLASERPDPDAVTRLEALRDMILPDGLATTQASYETESLLASRAAEAVASDPEAQRLLREIRLLPRVSGLELLSLWSDLGTRLGSVELRRASSHDPSSPVRARNAWLGVVASMLSVLPIVRSEAARRAVHDPLQQACALAAAVRQGRPPAG